MRHLGLIRWIAGLTLALIVVLAGESIAQEEISVSDDTPPAATQAAVEEPFGFDDWAAMLGRFHPIVLHFPIGLLVAVFLLELAGIFRRFHNIEAAHWLLLLLGTGAAIVAATFGVFLSWEGGYDETTVFWHQWTGIGVAVLAVVAVALRVSVDRSLNHSTQNAYRFVLFANVILVSVAGHFGGNLTHGSAYLFENMPPWMPVSMLHQSGDGSAGVAGSAFAEIIEPIFEAKCYECHGEEKMKGDYKMTTRELLLTPGESGKAPLVPGNAMASELVRVIALPGEHEAVMPPEGKGALSGDDVIAIMQWIDRGADFGDGENTLVLAKEKSTPANVDTSVLDTDEKIDFETHIWPIIQASCLECHDEEEQDGDLRLDTKEYILEGGEFGDVLEPGSPDDSTFYELIMLPEDDTDFMPAKNDPLPDAQLELIKRWIEEGCDFGEWTGE
ncbi:MAG: c-type cytochrome domain-containing protein [Candidatus Hydrogenedentota bacterium]